MQFKTSVTKFGVSTYVLLPKEMIAYLELEEGQEKVIMEEHKKSKGKFAAFWKNEKR